MEPAFQISEHIDISNLYTPIYGANNERFGAFTIDHYAHVDRLNPSLGKFRIT